MGLFVKKETPIHAPLYTVSASSTRLIVGLGNPGDQYESTRHNIGFNCLDRYALDQQFPGWTVMKQCHAQTASQTFGATRVVLAKPTTFMNDSGRAVQALAAYYKLPAGQVIVVHDELDIPFGEIRLKSGGGTAGHNGLKSIVQHLGEDFIRIRIGIRNPLTDKADSADFVLSRFDPTEQTHQLALTAEVASLLNEIVYAPAGTLPSGSRQFIV